MPNIRFTSALITGLLAAIAVLAVMDALTLHVATGIAASFDQYVRAAVHSLASPPLTEIFKRETWLGTAAVLTPVSVMAALWLMWRREIAAAVLSLVALAGAAALTEITKTIVQRPRPEPFFGVTPETWSFPSGHSLESAAVYWTLAAIVAARASSPARRFVLYSLAVLPLITGLSRIYLGVHYPTDVIAGWAAGACWCAGVIRALRIE